MKKLLSVLLTFVMILGLCACGNNTTGNDTTGNGGKREKKTIGIIQFGSHGSLTNCYDGVVKGLEAKLEKDSYTIELVNSNFDPSVSQSQANKFVNSKADIIIAIATPSAVAAANAAADSDTPVVYCAITDASVMDNYSNITGSSDVPNFEKQLEVVTGFMGKGNIKIGVLYSTDESSSPFMIKKLKEAAEKYDGMEILDSAVADMTTIDAKTNELIDRGVDCFVNILDNTVVGKLESNILPITNEKNIPIFGSEIEQVKVGCAASASIDYITVGQLAGEAAADILNGKKADDIPVQTITEPTNYYNSEVCGRLGLTVPASLEVTDVK